MYNKLFTKILDSSIWLEANTTRIVWITFIAAMDDDGYAAFGSVQNLARRANVTISEADDAVGVLEGPDSHNPEQENAGRRIERVDGGWLVLNAGKYREMVNRVIAREKTRTRVADFRARRRGASNADVTESNALAANASATANAPAADQERQSDAEPPRNLPALRNGQALTIGVVAERVGDIFRQINNGARSKLSGEQALRLKAEMVFYYWCAKFDHMNSRLDAKREARIVSRLKENDGDVNEIFYALDGAHADDFIMARGEHSTKKRYDGIETVLRDRGQVERFSQSRAKFVRGDRHPKIAQLEEALHAPAREAVDTAAEVAHA